MFRSLFKLNSVWKCRNPCLFDRVRDFKRIFLCIFFVWTEDPTHPALFVFVFPAGAGRAIYYVILPRVLCATVHLVNTCGVLGY
uniref:Uncharacterized protein n=1 Tax=Carp adomavirus TaxID=2609874 RepID=A0A6F9F1X1_9VIRU|nr:TPA_asm: hypothetical protein [Carp adomavirus]